jgi:chromosomal replication initiator protein
MTRESVLLNQSYQPNELDVITDVVQSVTAVSNVKEKTRVRNVVDARHIAIYMAVRYTHHKLGVIGAYFGNRDHSSVIHARNKITSLIVNDKNIASMVNEIIRILDVEFNKR